MVVGIPVTLVDNCILQCVITTTSVGGSLKYYNGFVQKWHISGKPLVNHHMSRWIDTFGVYTLFSDIPKICHCFPIQQITNKQQLSAWLYRVTYWWQKYATENWWHMSIEYLENRRNLPSDGVMLLAMKQDRHQNGMPTVCVCRYLWKHLISTACTLSKKFVQERIGNCSFISCFPRWSAPKQRKNSKTAKKPVERMETATYQEFGRSRTKQRKTLKIAEKNRENKPCAIGLYVVTCSNSAGNLGNGRKKLGFLVPLAQWNHENEAFLQWEKHGNCNFLSSFPDGAPQSKGKTRKRQRNPLKGWKLQFFQQFGRSRPAQRKGKPWKLQRK